MFLHQFTEFIFLQILTPLLVVPEILEPEVLSLSLESSFHTALTFFPFFIYSRVLEGRPVPGGINLFWNLPVFPFLFFSFFFLMQEDSKQEINEPGKERPHEITSSLEPIIFEKEEFQR